MKDEKVDLLFFGAHADDLELSCGGTIAKYVKDGLRVGMIELTRGELGTRGTPEIREREARAAAGILGAHVRTQLDFGDGGLRTGREEEMELIDVIRRYRPSIVIAAPAGSPARRACGRRGRSARALPPRIG